MMDIEDKIYNNLFKGKKKALDTALDTRKFEIEMYWKRATYFWAFNISIFTAFFLILSKENNDSYKAIIILISLLGFLFSLGWYFVNRGSKYWQSNWEAHVSRLENEKQGPLFSCIITPENHFIKLNKDYPFSVSKVNQMLSLIVTLFWVLLFIFSILYAFDRIDEFKGTIKDIKKIPLKYLLISSIVLLIVLFYFFKKQSHSFAREKLTSKKKTNFFLTYLNNCLILMDMTDSEKIIHEKINSILYEFSDKRMINLHDFYKEKFGNHQNDIDDRDLIIDIMQENKLIARHPNKSNNEIFVIQSTGFMINTNGGWLKHLEKLFEEKIIDDNKRKKEIEKLNFDLSVSKFVSKTKIWTFVIAGLSFILSIIALCVNN